MKTNLALRAINQYRTRDILPYLGLRYYLQNSAGRKNRWIKEICTRLTNDSEDLDYFKTFHFKDFSDDNFEYRDIYIPAPNEALAEVDILTEVAKHTAFRPQDCVYSYLYPKGDETCGVFQPYFNGFKKRHRSIANVCKQNPKGVVLCTDIKKFYPSIQWGDALMAWNRCCEKSDLEKAYKELGRKILSKHRRISERDATGKGLLTGPIFSHTIANLLLDPIDAKMVTISNGRYWRYVDDVVLVGSKDEVYEWRNKLAEEFSNLNLDLHDGDKDFSVPCDEWLKSELDFDDNIGVEWAVLIGEIKRFLLANPSKSVELQDVFRKNHIRIPVIDYSNAVKESGYLERIQDWITQYRWAKVKIQTISIEYLVAQAKQCEALYTSRLDDLLTRPDSTIQFEAKRFIPKVKYLAGRLLYLLSREELMQLFPKLDNKPELFLIFKTMEAIATRDATDIVQMGVNAAQSTAQLLRVDQDKVEIDKFLKITAVVEQSFAIFTINGIKFDFTIKDSEIGLLAKGQNIQRLFNSEDSFIKQVACLHGVTDAKHQDILDSAFDRNEDLALDILNLIHKSKYN